MQLSLAHCGIGPAGAAALAASLHPDPNRQLAEAQPKWVLGAGSVELGLKLSALPARWL